MRSYARGNASRASGLVSIHTVFSSVDSPMTSSRFHARARLPSIHRTALRTRPGADRAGSDSLDHPLRPVRLVVQMAAARVVGDLNRVFFSHERNETATGPQISSRALTASP